MAQFATAKNPPWVRGTGAASNLVQPPGTSLGNTILAAQATTAGAGPGQIATAGVSAGTLATAAAVVAAAQSQQGQQAPAVSAAYGTGLAAITLTQSALQQGAVLQQPTIGIPASLAATTQVSNGVVVELARLPQPGVALPTSLATTQVATVSYPAPRLLAQAGQFQAPQAHAQTTVVQQATAAQVPQQQPQQQALKQRVFTGTVTKLHENFGFVDEDVFFQMSAVKGNIPKAGERVLVEAAYNPNMPFKWNATRIQVLPNQPNQLNVQQAANNRAIAQPAPMNATVLTTPVSAGLPMQGVSVAVASNQSPFPNMNQQGRWQVQQELAVIEQMGPQRMNIQYDNRMEGPHPWIQDIEYAEMMDNKGPRLAGVSRRHSPPPPPRRERERERELRRDERRDRYRERERERYSPPPPRKRSRSPRRPSRSPPRRRQRVAPRYTVQVPKISLDVKEGNLIELRKRYTNLYIPSDFCSASFLWQDAFPPHQAFNLDHPCNFHIVSKDCEPVVEKETPQEPTDTDHLYSAKVMLLASPPLKEIFKKSCALAEDCDDTKENFVHPTRLISFLVGLKGKNETVAIGGPWSPSLDGPNPDKDPGVLIKTAIRTCKSLTGIDLSQCSQWYRFAEIFYRRGESTHKGRVLPTRVETVVLFLPDVWSCLPTRVEWDGLICSYKKQLPKKLPAESTETAVPVTQVQWSSLLGMDEEEGGEPVERPEPTHFSELDPKTIKPSLHAHFVVRNGHGEMLVKERMVCNRSFFASASQLQLAVFLSENIIEGAQKVSDLKRELEARNLSTKGLKSQLIVRLTKALKVESAKEDNGEQSTEAESDERGDKPEADEIVKEEKKSEETEKKAKDQKDRPHEKKCQLPETPSIIVQPSRTAKGGKFDCTIMSLSLLLDYRQEDNKEHSFEVSLFAELFNEMMMRDFGFRIYCSLVEIPDSKDDEKDKKRSDKKDEQKHKKEEKDDYRRKDDGDNDSDKDDEDSDDDEYDGDDKKDRERKRRKKKKPLMHTYDPYLLLSYIYYDQTHCGYLLDKDLEEIMYTLGLQLSRAQVRKVIQKVCKRESLHYRKLTDKPVGETEKQNSNDNPKINIEELAAGNKKYLPGFGSTSSDDSQMNGENQESENGVISNGENNALVTYQGALVDVGKLLKQLERSEKARLETEQNLKKLENELDGVNELASSKEKQSQKLSMDLEEQQQKLQSTEEDLKKVLGLNEKYQRALQSCRDQMFAATTTVDSALKARSSRSSTSRSNGNSWSRKSTDSDISSKDIKPNIRELLHEKDSKQNKDSYKTNNVNIDDKNDIPESSQEKRPNTVMDTE